MGYFDGTFLWDFLMGLFDMTILQDGAFDGKFVWNILMGHFDRTF